MNKLVIYIGCFYNIELQKIRWFESSNKTDIRIFGIYGESLITVYPKNLKENKYLKQKKENLSIYLARQFNFEASDFFNPLLQTINQEYINSFTFSKKPLTHNFVKSNNLEQLTNYKTL